MPPAALLAWKGKIGLQAGGQPQTTWNSWRPAIPGPRRGRSLPPGPKTRVDPSACKQALSNSSTQKLDEPMAVCRPPIPRRPPSVILVVAGLRLLCALCSCCTDSYTDGNAVGCSSLIMCTWFPHQSMLTWSDTIASLTVAKLMAQNQRVSAS